MLPLMPAMMGISEASATKLPIAVSNKPTTREIKKTATKLNPSHAQRFLNRRNTGANKSSSSAMPAADKSPCSRALWTCSNNSSIVRRPTTRPEESTTGAEMRSYFSNALAASSTGAPGREKIQLARHHRRRDFGRGRIQEKPLERQHADQPPVIVDDEKFVAMARQFAGFLQAGDDGGDGLVGARGDRREIHNRADRLFGERQTGAKRFVVGDSDQPRQSSALRGRQIAQKRGDVVGRQAGQGAREIGFGRGIEQGFENPLRDLDHHQPRRFRIQNAPRGEPLFQRQRFEQIG